MAMVKCPECAAAISDRASACPQCGAPQAAAEPKDRKGAKIAQLVGFLLLALGVVMTLPAANAPVGVGPGLLVIGILLYAGGRVAAWLSAR